MKQGKKLNRKMKQFLEEKGLNSEKYLVERETSTEVGFINKDIKQVIYFKCDWGKV